MGSHLAHVTKPKGLPVPVMLLLGLALGGCQETATAPIEAGALEDQAAVRATYTVVDLGSLGGDFSVALDINARGQVVGQSETASGEFHAFLWEDGVMTDLGTLGADPSGFGFSYAIAINNQGEVVGQSTTPDGEFDSFIWKHGTMTDLGPLGEVTDINSRGQVVGTTFGQRAFRWEKGVITDLGTLGHASRANAINSGGTVVGDYFIDEDLRAFIWEKGVMRDLGTLGPSPGGADVGFTRATGINSRGQVVGASFSAQGSEHAFLWEKGVMTDLGTLGGFSSSAEDINPRGQVVGTSVTPSGEQHAFIWDKGVMKDLGTLGPNFTFGIALAINPRGDVVGQISTDGPDIRAVLWTRKSSRFAAAEQVTGVGPNRRAQRQRIDPTPGTPRRRVQTSVPTFPDHPAHF
jgi:probable HAF family extracellular repeat protein